MKDLKVFSSFSEDLFKEITQLITLDNFRYGFHTKLNKLWLLRGDDCVSC